jgi:hypothetical protein
MICSGTNFEKNSESIKNRALEIIEKIVELLDEDLIARKYDQPVDEVLRRFEFVKDIEYSHAEFHRLTAAFVRILYRKIFGRKLSDRLSKDKAVSLLKETYRGASDGYDDALFEAADRSHAGLYCVLLKMSDCFKTKHRQRYIHWTTIRYIKFADWHTRCELAKILLHRYEPWLPGYLQKCPPEELADFVPELLNIHMSMNSS